jgi:hypothetical protein
MIAPIETLTDQIADFCRRWEIVEFSLFGSVLREDFGPDSDIDVLVTCADDARHTLFDGMHMKDELERIFGRKVDLLQERWVTNPYRRRAVLRSKEVVYAAG